MSASHEMPVPPSPDGSDHDLHRELREKIQTDPRYFEFLREGSLDGVWYWDLENPEDEWMSPEFWRLLGYDPATKEHKAHEWQDLIDPTDLETAQENLARHLENPNHPYDQIVRYRHAEGRTVWVRCRGVAIREGETGRPVRMLGAHNDLSRLIETKARLEAASIQVDALVQQIEEKNATIEQLRSEVERLQVEAVARRPNAS